MSSGPHDSLVHLNRPLLKQFYKEDHNKANALFGTQYGMLEGQWWLRSLKLSIDNPQCLFRGIHPNWGVMTYDFPTVTPDMSLSDVMNKLVESRHHGFPVINEDGKLTGIITLADVENRLSSGEENLAVADVATTDLITAYPDETLHDVVQRLLGTSEIGHIPVVDRKDPTILLGILRRRDLVKAYAKGLSRSIREDKE